MTASALMSSQARRIPWESVLLAAITAIAAFLRLYRLDLYPPGVHCDEAVYGLQAIDILKGQLAVYYSAYTGHEPLYMYLVALVFLFAGRGVWGLRLATSLIGIATVPAAYLALREMFGRRVALLGAFLIATSYWHLNATRIAYSATLMPLTECIAIYLLWRGYRSGKAWLLALGGAATALNLYVYLSSRFFPIALALMFVYLLCVDRQRLFSRWRGLLLALLVALLVVMPLAIHFWRAPHDLWERTNQVRAWGSGQGAGFWRVLAGNLKSMLLTFLPRIDTRYALLGRPALDPLVGPFFLLGLALALRRLRRPEHGVLILWWFTMALPPLLTHEQYNVSQRLLGTIPPLYGLAALGFDAVWGWASARARWRLLVPAALSAILIGEAAWGAWYYFAVWSQSTETYLWHQSDVTEIPRLIAPELAAGHHVVIAAQHYHHASVVFINPASLQATWVQGRQTVVLPGWDGREIDYFVPAYDARPIAAARRVLEAAACSQEEFHNQRGDTIVYLYRICRPPVVDHPPAPLAIYGDEVALWSAELPDTAPQGKSLRVGLQWEALRAVAGERCFAVHLVDEAGSRWSQADQLGYLPPEWRPGDQVWQWLEVPLPPSVAPGTYHVRVILAGEQARPLVTHNARGAPTGTYLDAGVVRVTPDQRWIEPVDPAAPQLGPLRVRAWTPVDEQRNPGEKVAAEVTWQLEGKAAGPLAAELEFRAEDGRAITRHSVPLAVGYPVAGWQPNEVVRQRYRVPIPADAAEGRYGLWLRVSGQEGELALGAVRVAGLKRLMEPPPIQRAFPAPVSLDGKVELLGYDLQNDSQGPGDPVRLTLYWRALAPMETNYVVFVHLLNGDGGIVSQRDVSPGEGARPTTGWLPGEVIVDTHVLSPAPAWPAGTYRLAAGMYDPSTMARLAMYDAASGRVPDDRLLLGQVEVR